MTPYTIVFLRYFSHKRSCHKSQLRYRSIERLAHSSCWVELISEELFLFQWTWDLTYWDFLAKFLLMHYYTTLNYYLFVWSTVFQPNWNDIQISYKNYENRLKSYCFLDQTHKWIWNTRYIGVGSVKKKYCIFDRKNGKIANAWTDALSESISTNCASEMYFPI